ncbi:NAD-dependent epimerase/dehydratase family protein [Halalkalicoccus salilacus]|uniref:NAD-dependent epimerase/dehydratase family protein n=1 Tax=Halalkalicoccus salilacus TaxID=3117459 RepID=UPI00300EEABC
MKVAITGASGNVGRQALAAFEETDHEITPITHDETEDIEGLIADVTDYESVSEALSGQEVVIHLAANPSPEAEWEDVLGVNVDGAYNVYEAAVENGLDRVVFASTNHVSQMYNAASPDEPESLVEDPDVIDPDDPPRPDSYYGVSKVAGEVLGSYYADRHGLEIVNVRIGWLMDESELEETQDDAERRARFARAMWLSPGDCRNAIRGATTASLPENPVTVNVVSANDDRYLSLTHAIRGIGYRPRDNATEALCDDTR